MGKTKIKTIDDSAPVEDSKKATRIKNKQLRDKSEEIAASADQSLSEPGESDESARSESTKSDEPVTEGQASLTGENGDSERKIQAKKEKKSKRAVKKGQVKYRSKKYQEVAQKIEKNKKYLVDEAVNLAKQAQYSKFEGSLEIHINTAIKNLRGLVSLPFASGKKLTILAFGRGAESSGADMIGDDDKLEEIMKGKIDFDALVTTAEWMPKLARAAKVLGPRGLMPSPKNGTISDDLKKAVLELQSGKVEYKTQKDSQVIHLSIGKVSQPQEELSQNIKILLANIGKSKIKGVTIAPSMGPGVKLDISSI